MAEVNTSQNTASGINRADEAVCKAIERLLDIPLPELRETIPDGGFFIGRLAIVAVVIVVAVGIFKRRQIIKDKRNPKDILG